MKVAEHCEVARAVRSRERETDRLAGEGGRQGWMGENLNQPEIF